MNSMRLIKEVWQNFDWPFIIKNEKRAQFD